jgi:transcriptional regulator with XRE-family HTH domain
MDIKKEIGIKIRNLRKEKGLSQEALANLSDLDRTYIPSIERGERNISIEVIYKLCNALNIRISDLFKQIEK